jgi:ribonuclease VapC
LSGYVIDTSALVAILIAEPEAERLMGFLESDTESSISAATLHETFCVCSRPEIERGPERLERTIALLEPEIVAFGLEHLEAARTAYRRFGRASGHAANLNMGDCFAYALAKVRGLPLLYKGDDFARTDIASALDLMGTRP